MNCTILSIVSCIIFIPAAIAITKTLTYKDDVCGGAYRHNRQQSFRVIYAGERTGSICRDMSFWGWDGDEGASYESCVTVTKFDLRCDIHLEYRTGTSRGKPSRTYDCSESASSIPTFCTNEILYIRVNAKNKNPSSVEYTVSSGAEKSVKSDFESASSTMWIGPVVIVAVILFVIIFVVYIRKKRAAAFAQQNQCPAVGYTTQPGSYQPSSAQHQQAYMYTPVNQTIIPPPGAAPQQQQGYYPQQTNSTAPTTQQQLYQHPYQQQATYTPQFTDPTHQQQPHQQPYQQPAHFQPYADSRTEQNQQCNPDTTPSAPPMFPSSNTNTNTLQSEPFLPPPSYDEVQKQKF